MRWHLIVGKVVFLLAYGLLYGQLEPFPCTAEGCRRILDVYAGSEQRSGCAALYGQLRFEVDVDALKVANSVYATNRALRSRHMAEYHRIEMPMYTKQTVYDTLQMHDQSRFIWFHCHWY